MQRQKVLRSWHAPAKVLNMESDKVTDSENGKEMAMESQVISPVLRRRLQQCYEHGCKLMTDGAYDYDYVHAMFLECVIKDPGNLVYVEVFLENLQRKFGDNKKGAKFKGLGGRGPFKKAVAKGDWEQILQLGPELRGQDLVRRQDERRLRQRFDGVGEDEGLARASRAGECDARRASS